MLHWFHPRSLYPLHRSRTYPVLLYPSLTWICKLHIPYTTSLTLPSFPSCTISYPAPHTSASWSCCCHNCKIWSRQTSLRCCRCWIACSCRWRRTSRTKYNSPSCNLIINTSFPSFRHTRIGDMRKCRDTEMSCTYRQTLSKPNYSYCQMV